MWEEGRILRMRFSALRFIKAPLEPGSNSPFSHSLTRAGISTRHPVNPDRLIASNRLGP